MENDALVYKIAETQALFVKELTHILLIIKHDFLTNIRKCAIMKELGVMFKVMPSNSEWNRMEVLS